MDIAPEILLMKKMSQDLNSLCSARTGGFGNGGLKSARDSTQENSGEDKSKLVEISEILTVPLSEILSEIALMKHK